tara:strand:- start:1778 stop:2473 length:696 start_codon:yes stop_codon:yes gene_type:complete
MGITKAARMAMAQMRKSVPSKPMNKNDAARVESAIRNNPKMYQGLAPSQVLEMLPPKGRTGEVIGMPIRGKTTKKFFGGALKGGKKIIDLVKKKINKKDSKGNTVSILGKPSANQTKIKKAQKQQRTTRREKLKSFGKGLGTATAIALGAEGLKGKNYQTQADPKPKKKAVYKPTSIPIPKSRPKNPKMYMKERSGKDSNVEFGVGKAKKKLFSGGKVGMKSGPAPSNRLY